MKALCICLCLCLCYLGQLEFKITGVHLSVRQSAVEGVFQGLHAKAYPGLIPVG